ncbi:hypothetical protein V496_01907 [Pseudogymnoascus sp. VKM F-4515 (FW-2607)]|nr:hypothetical protein V496_01907 [Pseudogymnoascus sp. VKM F-4515 (FW-2607)]
MAATEGTLTFFERGSWPSHERPYELLFQPPSSDFPVCNYNVTQVPNVQINDLRPLKGKFSLDREGFLIADINTRMEYEDYFDQEKLKSTYMPEIKAHLKEKLGVRAVYIHECVVRQSGGNGGHSGSFGQPIPNVHTGDRSTAETIKKSRIQMLNIWKPLRGPLRSWPLALCDLRSLSREDVITFDEVHTTAVLESQQVVYNPSQKWYYLSDQEPNELIVFKSMDTAVRGEVAHGSFWDPKCPDNEPPRESIELRILVVY